MKLQKFEVPGNLSMVYLTQKHNVILISFQIFEPLQDCNQHFLFTSDKAD